MPVSTCKYLPNHKQSLDTKFGSHTCLNYISLKTSKIDDGTVDDVDLLTEIVRKTSTLYNVNPN